LETTLPLHTQNSHPTTFNQREYAVVPVNIGGGWINTFPIHPIDVIIWIWRQKICIVSRSCASRDAIDADLWNIKSLGCEDFKQRKLHGNIATETEPKLRKKAGKTILSTPYWINRFPAPLAP
jgi:hypothetical protein